MPRQDILKGNKDVGRYIFLLKDYSRYPIIKSHSERRFVLYENIKQRRRNNGKNRYVYQRVHEQSEVFADAFNYYFFHGKQVVKPDELTIQDTNELSLTYGEDDGVIVPTQKIRDVLKMWTIMTSEDATYMLLGIENLIKDYKDIYSNLDKISGYLLEMLTDTQLPKSAEKEDSINMCKAIEEMLEEAEARGIEKANMESAKILFENGGTMEMALKIFPSLKEAELLEIKGTCN